MALFPSNVSASNVSGGGFLPRGGANFLVRRIQEIAGLCLVALSLAGMTALASFAPADPSLNAVSGGEAGNLLGYPGAMFADLVLQSVGLAAVLMVTVPGAWGWRLLTHRPVTAPAGRIAGLLIGTVAASLAFALLPVVSAWPSHAGPGGVVGSLSLAWALNLAPNLTSLLPIVGLSLAILAVGFCIWSIGAGAGEWVEAARALPGRLRDGASLSLRGGRLVGRGMSASAEFARRKFDRHQRAEPKFQATQATRPARPVNREMRDQAGTEPHLEQPTSLTAPAIHGDARMEEPVKRARRPVKPVQKSLALAGEYQFPDMDLLSEAQGPSGYGPDKASLEANARMLEAVLQDFGVKGQITSYRHGPVVTLYELEPAPGTKSARVIGLSDDIARSMSAISVRVAVVPGRNVIGIELPNARRDMVYLRELLEADGYVKSGGKLAIALGKDISGTPVIVDLARMPHLLIAGTTGSGKSVAVNTMILSLLYRLSPEQCRMIMIDPKMLELSVYDGIPHLLTPVVTDPKKAVVALKWTVREMETRYHAMSKMGVRNIDGYNARINEARKKGEVLKRRVQTGFDSETGKPVFEDEPLDLTPLPYIVVVIDEVADLMLVAGKDIEGAVQRLAQMARAAGIPVVMATQRPSVDVITGTIKANFPTRISFQVTSKIDSRTILGEQGAEQLLGQGDMLHMAGGGRITRVHGPFCSDEEVEDVVRHLRTQGEPDYNDTITEDDGGFDAMAEFGATGGGGGSGDDLYDQAVALVAREGKASTSFVQRHLKIGYNRAATIIERMEAENVVSSANHVGKREVLVGDHTD
jgi:S-DNA-T family DNA segregation ATPase FtsK/SpoIIIE